MPDGERLFAAMLGARSGVDDVQSWHHARVLPDTDPAVRAAIAAGQGWAARYPVRRTADPHGVNALVLER